MSSKPTSKRKPRNAASELVPKAESVRMPLSSKSQEEAEGRAVAKKRKPAPRVKGASHALPGSGDQAAPITEKKEGLIPAVSDVMPGQPEAGARRKSARPPAKSRPATTAKASTEGPYRIFQIFYESWHRDLLDPLFTPLDNIGAPSELLEFDVFERLWRSDAVAGAPFWGALSWRFTEKTGLTGADLIDALSAQPDADVFYCNPHVANEALYHNMWVQGETTHPRFLEISKALFEATGLPMAEFEQLMPSTSYSAANYFIGRPIFWDAYIPFIRKIVTIAEQRLSTEARALLHSKLADDKGLHGGSTYLPFIVERLFPLFMRSAGAKLRCQRIALRSKEQELNVHMKMLREMKDVAIQTKSPWLAACWVNYRALYMSQSHGREWCQKYLRSITPTQIRFP